MATRATKHARGGSKQRTSRYLTIVIKNGKRASEEERMFQIYFISVALEGYE